ncbi:DUF1850 domain-containing protein [Guptibacillus algicola]|uniref:DUF1850 domain-containing protein n=1 Tax=Guptibacillus algicola TaxID=225844 RepID=UPI001CD2F85A|nr:DUF1850 domain-containing protein [Alkalihalobacillus algicola]MCA0988649.1 DUF1850 domain-containing protein [Alkalihalobacillus algicola]
MNRTKWGHRQGAPIFLKWFFLFAIVLALFAIPMNVLVVEEEKEVIDVFLRADTFSVRWEHSVEKEEWEEFFQREGSELILTHTRFKTFGAGVPSHAGKETFIKEGWVYMTGIDQSIDDSLFVRTGDVTKHRLTVAGQSEKLKANSSYHITVKKLNLFRALLVKLTC